MTPGELVLSILLVAATFVLSLVSSELSRARARERYWRERSSAALDALAKALDTPCRVCDAHPAIYDPEA